MEKIVIKMVKKIWSHLKSNFKMLTIKIYKPKNVQRYRINIITIVQIYSTPRHEGK